MKTLKVNMNQKISKGLPSKRRAREIKLMEQFLKENPMILDDDIPSKFEEWITTK